MDSQNGRLVPLEENFMEKIEGRTITGETIRLDGKEITNCTLRNCQFIYGGTGSVGLHKNKFIDCRFSLDGAAANTVDFLRVLYVGGAVDVVRDWLPELLATRQ